MDRYRAFGISGLVLLLVVLVFVFAYIWAGGISQAGYSGTFTQSGLNSVNTASPGVTVSEAGNLIYINESTTLPVMMGPMNASSMYSFEILGLINPELVIQMGVKVHFTAVNIDDDSSHNFVLATSGPPYGYAMGGNMMRGGGYMTMMPYLSPESSGHYSYMNFTYTFSHSGTFWYLCTYPGHAQLGMYGKIMVS